MSSEDRLREGGSDEEEESGENGEPEKKKLRKRERVAKMFERDGRATNLAEGSPFHLKIPFILLQNFC